MEQLVFTMRPGGRDGWRLNRNGRLEGVNGLRAQIAPAIELPHSSQQKA